MRRFFVLIALVLLLVSCSSLRLGRKSVCDERLEASVGAGQDYVFNRAVRNILEDRFDAAMDLLQYSMDMDTVTAANCFYLAQLYMSFRERSIARMYMPLCDSLLSESVRLEPDNYWYRRLYALNLLRMNRKQDAVFQYEEMSRRFPGNSEILLDMASLYGELGQFDKELKALTRYGQLEDVVDELRMQRVACYLEMNELDSAYLETDEPEVILDALTDEVSKMLDAMKTDMDRMQCRYMIDMVAGFADVALKYDSSLFQAWKSKAITQLWLGTDDKALETLGMGIGMVADSVSRSQLYGMRADCYTLKGRDRAIIYADYDSALVYNPNDVMVMNNYAYFLSLDGRDLKRALKMSAITIEKEPLNATFLDTYAWILFRMERYSQAREYLEKALQYMEEPNPDMYEHYGDVMYKCGDIEAALENWHIAFQLNSESKLLESKIREKRYLEE